MRIALFEPDIPQNAGNIFRLGACLGIPVDIIEPAGFVIDDKRLKRASMDYYDYLELKKHLSWEKFYEWSKDNSYRLVLLTTKVKKVISIINFNQMILFYLAEKVQEHLILFIALSMKINNTNDKGPRSINLSSSVAIVAGEMLRQLIKLSFPSFLLDSPSLLA